MLTTAVCVARVEHDRNLKYPPIRVTVGVVLVDDADQRKHEGAECVVTLECAQARLLAESLMQHVRDVEQGR